MRTALLLWAAMGAGTAPPEVAFTGFPAAQSLAVDPQGVPFAAGPGGVIARFISRNHWLPLADGVGRPTGIAFDAAGDLYYLDAQRKSILKINSWGQITQIASKFASPERLAIGPDGGVYFTDRTASRVYRVEKSGKVSILTSAVKSPRGIAVAASDGRVFVGGDGGTIWSFAPDGSGGGQFAALSGEGQPVALALDEAENLYVARYGAGEVSVLDREGKPTGRYAVPGRKVSDLGFGGIDLKNLYVVESDSASVYRIRVPHRAQRLPWEPDKAVSITDPPDGAILNRQDGEVTSVGLRVVVKGSSRVAGPVRVNGTAVPVRDGRFEAAVVLTASENRVSAEAAGGQRDGVTLLWDRNSFPRYRLSLDDNILFLKDIAEHAGTYRSLFDNPYLAFWRDMHGKYGIKLHINVYYETEGFNLSRMPARFRPEWQRNADWIHLTFHAFANEPARPYIQASPERVRQDYLLVTREIERFAGKELLSPFTTVHWGSLTLPAARVLRAEGVRGFVGYFDVRDDLPAVAYYVPAPQLRYLSTHDYWKDTCEDLFFVRHDMVINTIPPEGIVPALEKIAADPHQAEVLELMIHEQYFYPEYQSYEPDFRQRVEQALAWVTRRGYKPVFYSEGFLGATP